MTAVGSPSRARSIVAPILFGLPVLGLLVGLGVWQLERLGWKEGVIASMGARVEATPAPLAPSSNWAALAATDYDYSRVAATGRFEPRVEALIFRASGTPVGGPEQPGYWAMSPFRLADGATLLVNRGFVSADRRVDPARLAGLPQGDVTITGLLRAPEARNWFTPADNVATGEWYTRDPGAIAAALSLGQAAPFSLDEDAYPAAPGLPGGGATVFDIPNNHLGYAATWFGLALTLVGVLGGFVWKRLHGETGD